MWEFCQRQVFSLMIYKLLHSALLELRNNYSYAKLKQYYQHVELLPMQLSCLVKMKNWSSSNGNTCRYSICAYPIALTSQYKNVISPYRIIFVGQPWKFFFTFIWYSSIFFNFYCHHLCAWNSVDHDLWLVILLG